MFPSAGTSSNSVPHKLSESKQILQRWPFKPAPLTPLRMHFVKEAITSVERTFGLTWALDVLSDCLTAVMIRDYPNFSVLVDRNFPVTDLVGIKKSEQKIEKDFVQSQPYLKQCPNTTPRAKCIRHPVWPPHLTYWCHLSPLNLINPRDYFCQHFPLIWEVPTSNFSDSQHFSFWSLLNPRFS